MTEEYGFAEMAFHRTHGPLLLDVNCEAEVSHAHHHVTLIRQLSSHLARAIDRLLGQVALQRIVCKVYSSLRILAVSYGCLEQAERVGEWRGTWQAMQCYHLVVLTVLNATHVASV